MENHALILALFGICTAMTALCWHIWQGWQLKVSIDGNIAMRKKHQEADETACLATIKAMVMVGHQPER
jgi:hypothetical protein